MCSLVTSKVTRPVRWQNSESGYCPWTSGTSRHPSVVGACVYLRTVDTLVLRDWFVLWGHKWSCLVQVILLSVFCVQYMFCLSWLGYNRCKLISHWQRCKLWIALKNGHCWVNCFWSHFSLSLSHLVHRLLGICFFPANNVNTARSCFVQLIA